MPNLTLREIEIVSTHSRAKAAATNPLNAFWKKAQFQHTAARRRLQYEKDNFGEVSTVSTHSRAKAAANSLSTVAPSSTRFQHTAARRRLLYITIYIYSY